MKQHCRIVCIVILTLIFLSNESRGNPDTLSYPPGSERIIPALNFKDTDIRDVLRSIAYEYQTNVVIDNQVSQKISTTLFNIKVFDALKIIAEDNNLTFGYDNQRFFIKTIKEKPAPSPPAPVEADAEVAFSNGRLTISANNVDIHKVVDKLREVTKKNYLVNNGTSGRVSGKLSNIDLDLGLRNIMQNNGFYVTLKDSIYYINRSAYFSSLENSGNQTRSSSYWVSAKRDKVTLDVTQANLDHVISDLSNQLGLQVIKLAAPGANVTVKCTEVPVEKAFEYLFKGTEFTFKKDGQAFIIGNKTSKSLDNTKLIKLKYLRADKVKEALPPALLQTVTANVSIEHNALVVSGLNESVSNFEDYIDAVDKPVPQVLIEALVVDFDHTKIRQFGLYAGKGDSAYIASRPNKYYPSVDATISGHRLNRLLEKAGTTKLFGKETNLAKLGKLPDDFFINLKALEQYDIVNIKSKPILSSLNGHTASLKIGEVQNYVFNEIMPVTNQLSSTFIERERIEKIEANISFEITPWIGPNNELTLEIKPEFQTPKGEFSPDKKMIPAISTRSFLSTVRIHDGETIILGGLIEEREGTMQDKFPILGDIPILGALFTNESKTKAKKELVVYITPKIQYGDEFGLLYYDYAK